MASALNKILSNNGNLLHVVRGKNFGEDAWHCVLLNKNQVKEYHKAVNQNDVEVDAFGRILLSGWGAGPSQEVLKELADQYM